MGHSKERFTLRLIPLNGGTTSPGASFSLREWPRIPKTAASSAAQDERLADVCPLVFGSVPSGGTLPHQQVNIRDAQNNSPLHIACQYGHVHIVKTLIQYNANPGETLTQFPISITRDKPSFKRIRLTS